MVEQGVLIAAFAFSEALSQLLNPIAPPSQDCVPLSKIFTGRIIHLTDRNFELPEEYIIRAVFPDKPIRIREPEPCFVDPTVMISRPDDESEFDPYALLKLDGRLTHIENEGEDNAFDSLYEALNSPEQQTP